MKGFVNRLGVVHLLSAQDVAGSDTASAWLDLKGFNGAAIVVNVGTLVGFDASGTASLTPVLQESDGTDATGATTVASTDMHGAFTKIDAASEDDTTQVVGYIGSKRYIRVNLDFGGTISAAPVSVEGLLGRPDVLPAVAPAAVAAT